MELTFDESGLIPAIVQDRLTGQVRMMAWMNREALDRTLETGLATFFSRSRGALWEKGETSGNRLKVHEIWADCDADVLLVQADPEGPSCHTGRPACFFRKLDGSITESAAPAGLLDWLERRVAERAAAAASESYTRALLDGGPAAIGEKLREEAAELAVAVASESAERVASEAADVVYHLLVALRLRGVEVRSVLEVLAARSGQSGHEEKASRGR